MAVYTDITEAELAAFLADYPVGRMHAYKGIAEGVENSNFLLHLDDASYILTLYEKRVAREDLPFFLGLMEHLAEKGLSCPLPIHRNDGALIGELAGRPAAVISFLEGMWPRDPAPRHCYAVGAEMAAMHRAGADFGLTRANALSLADWRPLWNASRDDARTLRPGLGDDIKGELAFLEANWPRDLPSGVIHADLFPDNVFFLDDRLSGLIDFYFACNDLLAYDVAVCLNAWCFSRDGAFDRASGRALLEGYESERTLTAGERAALPTLARGAALRFFLTRLYDWLATPEGAFVVKKDPFEYLRRLHFHRTVGTIADYGIDDEGDEAS
ncbi:homoserine kinase [Pararhizobium mangrovi]|uniref:Homoserine kinase n=1 Tax=Pararhizobium mangrovi TaxID=2590452 RepID=A0A506U6L1_9HYPH|nr:homoserine kinase [Pararhizobium mangrovi]TPW28704.1 homoserine kinase [Pararhizobium mangrovi]